MNTENKSIGTFTVDVQIQPNGKLDAYIAHEGSSGCHYTDMRAYLIGEKVAEDIESVAGVAGGYQMDTKMTLTRALELLNMVIDHEAAGRNCKDTIQHLLSIGFTGEELHGDFNFSLSDIADAEKDMEEYED